MTDTWWPLLRKDVWFLSLTLLIFNCLTWPFQTYRSQDGYIWNDSTSWKQSFECPVHLSAHVCFSSAIMDPVVNNAAEGSHCTTFSHENSFSLCRSISLAASSLLGPRQAFTKPFHLSPSTQSVSVCTANIKPGIRGKVEKCRSARCIGKSCSVECKCASVRIS